MVLFPNLGVFAAADHLGTRVGPLLALDCVRLDDRSSSWRFASHG
jgi:hypothetical protein